MTDREWMVTAPFVPPAKSIERLIGCISGSGEVVAAFVWIIEVAELAPV